MSCSKVTCVSKCLSLVVHHSEHVPEYHYIASVIYFKKTFHMLVVYLVLPKRMSSSAIFYSHFARAMQIRLMCNVTNMPQVLPSGMRKNWLFMVNHFLEI